MNWTIAASTKDQKRWDWKTCTVCRLTSPDVEGDPPRCKVATTCRAVLGGESLGGAPMLKEPLVRYDDPGPQDKITYTMVDGSTVRFAKAGPAWRGVVKKELIERALLLGMPEEIGEHIAKGKAQGKVDFGTPEVEFYYWTTDRGDLVFDAWLPGFKPADELANRKPDPFCGNCGHPYSKHGGELGAPAAGCCSCVEFSLSTENSKWKSI